LKVVGALRGTGGPPSGMADRAANDMAALIDSIGQSWNSISADRKEAFKLHFREHHDLFITENDVELTEIKQFYPFIPRLEKALRHHTGKSLSIKQAVAEDTEDLCFWVIIPLSEQSLRIGFLHERFGPHPPHAVVGILSAGCLLILIVTILLARRITRQIKTLSEATNQLGAGKLSTRISETGPDELKMLAQNFNRMAQEIAQLISNRSILFGGISHDLRTPITRMNISLELLQDTRHSPLIQGMKNDLNEMETLIQQALELVKGMDKHHAVNVELNKVLDEIVSDYLRQHLVIHWQHNECGVCMIEVNAFRRVLCNLLDNAFRYGNDKPVVLSCTKEQKKLVICVQDQGPGIPVDKLDVVFQPFYRLDSSRAKKTGGSGLGLAIVQQLCDIHDWKIQLITKKKSGLKVKLEIPVN
jgi:two-component system osmolarity sensor histidine kinase EnvZ